MKDKTILIYGYNGFIGRHFLKSFKHLIHHYKIYNLNRDITRRARLITDIETLNPDLIINFACKKSNRKDDIYNIYNVNCNGLMNLCSFNIPVISFSSIASLDSLDYKDNIYALTKYINELLTNSLVNLHLIRIPGIFHESRKEGFIYNCFNNMKENKEIIIDSNLYRWNFFYLNHLTFILSKVLIEDIDKIIKNKIVNIGFNENHTLSTIAYLIKEKLKSESKIIIKNEPKIFSLKNENEINLNSFFGLKEAIDEICLCMQ